MANVTARMECARSLRNISHCEPLEFVRFQSAGLKALAYFGEERRWLPQAVLAEHFVGKNRRLNQAADLSRPSLVSMRRVVLAAAVLAVTGLYLASMASGWLPFRTATLLYVPAVGLLLATDSIRSLPAVIARACVLAFGLDDLFTQVVDLP